MKTLIAYLAKEWRDQRAIFFGLLFALPPLLGLAAWALPSKAFTEMPFAVYVAIAWTAVLVFALSADLIAGEARRGRLGFLRRMPAGLSIAFWAKLIVFFGSVVSVALYAYGAGAVTVRLFDGSWPAAPDFKLVPGVSWLVLFAWGLPWIFAGACAVPRGVLAIPSVAVLFGLLGVPLYLLYRSLVGFIPTPWMFTWPLWALPVGGLLSAYLAFVRGRSRGGGWLRAVRWGLLGALVAVLPAYGFAGRDALEYHGYLGGQRCFLGCLVGAGEHYLFANTFRALPGKDLNGRPRLVGAPSVIVDLSTGRVREVEGPLRAYRDTDPVLPQFLVRGPGAVIFDGRTAEKIRPSKAQIQAALKTAPRWRTPDGRAVLRSGKGFSIAGGARIDLGRWATSHGWPCGLGLREGGRYVDFSRGRAYPRRGGALRGFFALIRPGRWLIHRYHGGGEEWGLFDPDTGARAPVQGLSRKDQFVVLHDDGRVFLRRGERTLLVDPETGAFRDCGRAAVFDPIIPGRFPGPVRTPGGARVYGLQTKTRTVLARFDDKTETFHAARAVRSAMLLALLDEERALVLAEGRTVARVRFDSDEYEVLFRLE